MKRRRTGRFQIRKKRSNGWSVTYRSDSSLLLVQQAVNLAIPLFHAGVPSIQTTVTLIRSGRFFFGGFGFFLVFLRWLLVLIPLLRRRVERQCQRNNCAQSNEQSEPCKI